MDLKKAVTSLLPFRIQSDLRAVINALSQSLIDLKVFLRDVTIEADPLTAVNTLEEWFDNEGLVYDPLISESEKQRQANQSFCSAGGQNQTYLEKEINKVFGDIELGTATISPTEMAGFGMAGLMMATDYPSWVTGVSPPDYPTFYYRVTGHVDYVTDLTKLENLLSRLMPLPFEPVFAVEISNLTPTAEAGLGMSGLMMAGRIRE